MCNFAWWHFHGTFLLGLGLYTSPRTWLTAWLCIPSTAHRVATISSALMRTKQMWAFVGSDSNDPDDCALCELRA